MTEFLSIWDTLKAEDTSRIDGSLTRAATLRRDIDDAQKLIVRLCERIDMSRAETEAVGVVTEFRLSPELGAAYGAYLRGRDVPRRVELTQISEAELGRLHGMGPKALDQLRGALAASGRCFADAER